MLFRSEAADIFMSGWPHSHYFLIKPADGTPVKGVSYYIRVDINKVGNSYKQSYYRERFVESKGTFSEKKPFMTATAKSAVLDCTQTIKNLKTKAKAGTGLIYNG